MINPEDYTGFLIAVLVLIIVITLLIITLIGINSDIKKRKKEEQRIKDIRDKYIQNEK